MVKKNKLLEYLESWAIWIWIKSTNFSDKIKWEKKLFRLWLWTFSGLEMEYAHFLPAYEKSFYLCAAWINNFSISCFNALQLILDLFTSVAWLFDWKPLNMDTYPRLFLTFFRATWLVRINFQREKNAFFFILTKISFRTTLIRGRANVQNKNANGH